MFHFTLEDRYLRRNPHFRAPSPLRDIAPPTGRVFPRSRTLPRFNDQHTANRFTSANGLTFYRDTLFGESFAGNVFVSEPVHNLVHRIVVEPEGATFTTRRAADETSREFVASSDNWFRPTSVRTGPDGAIWIADMYRSVIEHPQYFYEGNFQKLDVRAGVDRGRLYRVYPTRAKLRSLAPLAKVADSPSKLVPFLASPNGWVRDMAQQLIVRARATETTNDLLALARAGTTPQARVHALATLSAVASSTAVEKFVEALLERLRDEHPGVRRRAVRVSERFAESEIAARVSHAIAELAGDPDAFVRQQVAYSLGAFELDDTTGRALARLALDRDGAPYVGAAAMTLVPKRVEPMVLGLLEFYGSPAHDADRVLRTATGLFRALAAEKPAALATAVDLVLPMSVDAQSVSVRELNAVAAVLDAIAEAGAARDELLADASRREILQRVFGAARKIATSEMRDLEHRLAAIRLLGRRRPAKDDDARALATLLDARNPQSLSRTAAESIARMRSDVGASELVSGWKTLAPSLRSIVLDALVGNEGWSALLLDAIEAESVPATDLDADRRRRLLEHASERIRERAAIVLGRVDTNRADVIGKFASAKNLTGDVGRGLDVFAKRCAPCHQLGTSGHAVGPDLRALVDKSADFVITSVFDPNRSIESKFAQFTAITRQGTTVTGVVVEETSSSVTILGQEAKRDVILRSDLARLEATGRSMMPEGLEKELTPQDVADLVALLQEQYPPPKQFPGNAPRVIRAADDGSIELAAETAEIYGSTAIFEARYKNIGFWRSDDDRTVWVVDVPKDGAYAVDLDFAAAAGIEGGTILVEARGGQLAFVVPSTGTWDSYETRRIGELRLRAGRQRFLVRGKAPLRNFLFDLRTVKLTPIRTK